MGARDPSRYPKHAELWTTMDVLQVHEARHIPGGADVASDSSVARIANGLRPKRFKTCRYRSALYVIRVE